MFYIHSVYISFAIYNNKSTYSWQNAIYSYKDGEGKGG